MAIPPCPPLSTHPVLTPLSGTSHRAYHVSTHGATMSPRGLLLSIGKWDATVLTRMKLLYFFFHLHASLCCAAVSLVSACVNHCDVRWSSLQCQCVAGDWAQAGKPDPCASTLPHDDCIASVFVALSLQWQPHAVVSVLVAQESRVLSLE